MQSIARPAVVPAREYTSRGAGWAKNARSNTATLHVLQALSMLRCGQPGRDMPECAPRIVSMRPLMRQLRRSLPHVLAIPEVVHYGGCWAAESCSRRLLATPAMGPTAPCQSRSPADSMPSVQHSSFIGALYPLTSLPDARLAVLCKPQLICSCANRLRRPHGQ